MNEKEAVIRGREIRVTPFPCSTSFFLVSDEIYKRRKREREKTATTFTHSNFQ